MNSTGKQSNNQKRGGGRRLLGQATVELALALTFLALLLVGVADVARIFSEHLEVVHAAGVAARWSTLQPGLKGCTYPNPYTVEAHLVLADLGAETVAKLNPTVVVIPASDGSSVTVNITYTHTLLFGLIQNIPSNFTGGATMPGVITTPAACVSTPLPTSTPAPTRTATNTPTRTPTKTATNTPTVTPTVPTKTPTNTPTKTPTNTPTGTPTNTPLPTSTFTPTPTATPTSRLVVTELTAVKAIGNKPLYIKIVVTDGSVGQAGVTIVATANGTALSGWTDAGNGVYKLCPAGNFTGGVGSITVNATVSKAGFQSASASTTNVDGSACPP